MSGATLTAYELPIVWQELFTSSLEDSLLFYELMFGFGYADAPLPLPPGTRVGPEVYRLWGFGITGAQYILDRPMDEEEEEIEEESDGIPQENGEERPVPPSDDDLVGTIIPSVGLSGITDRWELEFALPPELSVDEHRAFVMALVANGATAVVVAVELNQFAIMSQVIDPFGIYIKVVQPLPESPTFRAKSKKVTGWYHFSPSPDAARVWYQQGGLGSDVRFLQAQTRNRGLIPKFGVEGRTSDLLKRLVSRGGRYAPITNEGLVFCQDWSGKSAFLLGAE